MLVVRLLVWSFLWPLGCLVSTRQHTCTRLYGHSCERFDRCISDCRLPPSVLLSISFAFRLAQSTRITIPLASCFLGSSLSDAISSFGSFVNSLRSTWSS